MKTCLSVYKETFRRIALSRAISGRSSARRRHDVRRVRRKDGTTRDADDVSDRRHRSRLRPALPSTDDDDDDRIRRILRGDGRR